MTAALRPGTVTRYAVGSVGTGGFGTLPGLVLLYYLTDALAVPALVAGGVVTLAKVWDVVVNPLVGYASDRDLARTGSRRRLMVIGGVTIPLTFALTFAVPPGLDPWMSATWVFVAFVLTATAFSLFQVPYIALPVEIAPTYDDRTRLLAWRVAILAVAILAFGGGGPILRGDGDELWGYLRMGVVAGLVIGIGMLVAAGAAPRGPAQAVAPERQPVGVVIRGAARTARATLARSQAFRALFFAFVLQALGVGLLLAGAQYVATYLLESEAAVTLLFAALIAPALLTMPLWSAVTRRLGKERGFILATVLFAVATAAMIPVIWSPGPWIYGPTALAGIAYAGLQVLPLAMLPDVVEDDARRYGAGAGGAFSGLWTAGETAGMALGGTLLSLLLAATGFVPSAAGVDVTQPSSALLGIGIGFSVLPALLAAASLPILMRYRLRRGDFDRSELSQEASP
ncbi:MFS transporter [Paraoerskovia marina]|uniref:MFS transporter n=1 Tax=Paraoerskovia marina TaxID=545619 RepID=UPI000492B4B1|nr:MFS transporter [Paraoerskovia marina]